MKKVILNLAILCAALSTSATANATTLNAPIEISYEWTELFTRDGVKVEYKYQVCENATVSNQVLVLFRFTNTTNEIKSLSWSTKEFRNDICTNCHKIDRPEYERTVVLSPGEVLEGDGTSKLDNRVYIFSHFINLVPGMSDQKLTDFEFVNVNVQTLQEL